MSDPASALAIARQSELRQKSWRRSARACSKLAATAAEALLLVRKLNSHNVTRLLKKPPAELKTALSHFCLSELLTPAGRERTTGLLTDLLKRHTRNGTLPDSFATELRHGCPTFFPYRQQQYLSAFRDFEATGKPDAPRCAPPRHLSAAHPPPPTSQPNGHSGSLMPAAPTNKKFGFPVLGTCGHSVLASACSAHGAFAVRGTRAKSTPASACSAYATAAAQGT